LILKELLPFQSVVPVFSLYIVLVALWTAIAKPWKRHGLEKQQREKKISGCIIPSFSFAILVWYPHAEYVCVLKFSFSRQAKHSTFLHYCYTKEEGGGEGEDRPCENLPICNMQLLEKRVSWNPPASDR
jgi:hypothetical protein